MNKTSSIFKVAKPFLYLAIFVFLEGYIFTLNHISVFPMIFAYEFIILLILNLKFQKTFKIYYFTVCLIMCLYLPIRLVIKDINVGDIFSLLNSNTNESLSYLQHINPFYYVLLLCFVILCYFIYKNVINIDKTKLNIKEFQNFALILFIIGFPLSLRLNMWYPTPSVLFIQKIYNKTNVVINYINQKDIPTKWDPKVNNREYNLYILVIGESARKDYISAFENNGFNNSPFLEKLNGTLYTNYYSAAPYTVASLVNTLYRQESGNYEYNDNIITLANKSNFETYWLSNQGTEADYDFIVSKVAKSAKYSSFSGKDSLLSHESDFNLITKYQRILATPSKKDKFIVLHLMGSHLPFCERTSGNYDKFVVNSDISCYIQSIKETDKLLESVVSIANQDGYKWSMIYFSDHGLESKEFLLKRWSELDFGDKTKYSYNVPFLISNYSDKKHIMNNNFYSAYDFLGVFKTWINVDERLIKKSCNVLSNCSVESKNIEFQNFDGSKQKLINIAT